MATHAPALPPATTHSLSLLLRDIASSVDERARGCNRRWGYNRLPHLVPIEWLEKFRRQKLKWQQACYDATPFPTQELIDVARTQANAMLRAYDKLEALAEEAGHTSLPAYQWEFELSDGTPVILVRERAELCRVDAGGRQCQVWALEEVADIIEKFPILVKAKDCFPGAEIIPMKTDKLVIGALDDALTDLPF